MKLNYKFLINLKRKKGVYLNILMLLTIPLEKYNLKRQAKAISFPVKKNYKRSAITEKNIKKKYMHFSTRKNQYNH
jgi:hypothetical protein